MGENFSHGRRQARARLKKGKSQVSIWTIYSEDRSGLPLDWYSDHPPRSFLQQQYGRAKVHQHVFPNSVKSAAFFSSLVLPPLDLHSPSSGYSKSDRTHALSVAKLVGSVKPSRWFVTGFLLRCRLDLRDEPGGLESQ